MITNENIQKFKNYGLVLTPVNKTNDIKDKSPVVKNGSWSADWTDQELLDANRLGAFHKESGIYDIDFDDKSLRANKFIDLLPRTLTIGKKVNGAVVATHKIYKLPEDVKFKSYNYPKAAKKGETIVETLAGTQTIIAGVDRVIIDNVEPAVLDPARVVGRDPARRGVRRGRERDFVYTKCSGRIGSEFVKNECEIEICFLFSERTC